MREPDLIVAAGAAVCPVHSDEVVRRECRAESTTDTIVQATIAHVQMVSHQQDLHASVESICRAGLSLWFLKGSLWI